MKPITRFLLLATLAVLAASAPAADSAPALSTDQAFAALKTYDEGQSTAPLLVIERFIGRISNDSTPRQETAGRLAALLADPQTSVVARKFICQQLALVGSDAQVPVLATLLNDPKTADMARLALQAMPSEAAGKTLLAALDRLKDDALIGVINSLGARRDAAAVQPLAMLLGDRAAKVAEAAAAALGKIGTKACVSALATAKPAPAVLDARLACAAELVRSGDAATAEPIYRKLCSSGQPTRIRMAALGGLVKAAPGTAMPQVAEAFTASPALVQNLVIELARSLPGTESTAALSKALPKLEGPPRLLALGALAERGDRSALDRLNKLAADKDQPVRGDASRELRRLRYAVKDAQLRELIEASVQDVGASIATLSPAPYEQPVVDQRKKQLAGSLSAGDKLACYLDCGVESSAQETGVTIRQMNGAGWGYPDSDKAVAPTFGTVAFDGSKVEFEIAGLNPQRSYAVGFSWWDVDNNGRVQSVQFSGGEPAKRVEALAATKLPAYIGAKEGPATVHLPIDSALISKGKMRVSLQRRAASNATVSELWVIETKPGSLTATKATIAGVPVGPASAPVPPKPEVNLTPFSDGTKILLVTGNDYPGHKWRLTAPVIKGLLERDPRLKVRIVEDPDALGVANLKQWDVVLLHFQNWETPGPGEASRENLKRFVENGGGLISVHFACGAWHGEWPEFQNIVGRVWHGSGPGKPQHDAYGKFLVEIADQDHPITKGIADFETTDELYTCLTGDAPIHLLAHSKSKVDQKYHPQAFVRDYGKGRVFLTTLGHDVNAWTNSPAVGELLRRASTWTAGQRPAM